MNRRLGFASICVTVLLATAAIVTTRPSWAVTAFAIATCASSSPCTGGTNTSTGSGVQGKSSRGKGVVGQTTFASNSLSNGQNGVYGQDLSTTGKYDTGVTGTSVRGFGVTGISSSNSGLRGMSTSGTGVFGTTSTGTQAILGNAVTTTGVIGQSTSTAGGVRSDGVDGNSFGGGNGVVGSAFGSGYGVVGRAFGSGAGVVAFAQNTNGLFAQANEYGVVGETQSTTGEFAAGVYGFASPPSGSTVFEAGVEGDNTSDNNPNVVAVYANGFGGGDLFLGNSYNGTDVFIVDDLGNVHAHSFTADLSATTRTSSGSTIPTYSQESRLPMIEDFGEAKLEAGQAYVRLHSDFASATTRGYYVFVTPLGPTQGLYVARRTASGFYVRENLSGRSNVAFDYRIVGERPAQEIPRPIVRTHVLKVRPKFPSFLTYRKQPISSP